MCCAIVADWTIRFLIAGWAFVPIVPGGRQPAGPTGAEEPRSAETQPAATQPAESTAADSAPPATPDEPAIKPRLELHVPSLARLVAEARRSHSGVLAEHLSKMLVEFGSLSSEGVDVESAASLLEKLKAWPDTPIDAVLYAADTEGRPRWAVRLGWPLEDLHTRLEPLLSLEAAETLLEGVTLTARPEGGHTLALPATTLAYLLTAGDAHSVVASHPDLEFPPDQFRGTEATEKDGSSLLVCRLNLRGTEKDSGATFWSSFAAVTDAVYACRVDEGGNWVERVQVSWPPIVGTGAKAFLKPVKQTFFVPDEAYGAAVFDALRGPAMLEGMAGFGPQMMMDESGGFTIIGEAAPGPITSFTDSEMCVTVLPGTGFMPVPDIVIQVRAKKAEKLVEGIREAGEKVNKLLREREQPARWHEAEVRDRPVFWSDGSSFRGGMMMPFVMRPVLFVTREIDAVDRQRDFLVMGLTSTSPQRLMKRWLDFARADDRRYLPTEAKVRGQLWVNWQQAYRWIQPYVNLSLSVISRDLLLPRMEDMSEHLTDGTATMEILYTGLSASYRGPIPAGVVVIPTLVGIAAQETVGTDLARERQACRKLKVLHHHAKLFKEDMGRWPAELAELDGYVDFAGHPYLLKLELSPQKRRSQWFEGLLGSAEEKEEEEEEDEEEDVWIKLDDDLFVIDWGRDAWTLGIAPDTFEHVDRLYIDQDGDIHRVERKPETASGDEQTAQ